MRYTVKQLRLRRGLGLVEMMISLAITVTLLTAVAAAFRASSDAIDVNDDFFRATQGARVSLARMLTQVRRGTPATDTTSSSLHLITDGGQDVNYNYNSSAQTLTYITNGSPTAHNYTLARNVSQCSFSTVNGTDSTGTACVAKVTIVIAVKVGDNQILLSGSAAPRRSLTY
jgi:Tfp pilus assembly protein PilW